MTEEYKYRSLEDIESENELDPNHGSLLSNHTQLGATEFLDSELYEMKDNNYKDAYYEAMANYYELDSYYESLLSKHTQLDAKYDRIGERYDQLLKDHRDLTIDHKDLRARYDILISENATLKNVLRDHTEVLKKIRSDLFRAGDLYPDDLDGHYGISSSDYRHN